MQPADYSRSSKQTSEGLSSIEMNTVQGKIIITESGLGIANLVVEIFDIDNQSNFSITDINFLEKLSLQYRLGGGITSSDGSFRIPYPIPIVNNKSSKTRADLLLVVFSPEEPGNEPVILYKPSKMRMNAAKIENYLIRISKGELLKARIFSEEISKDDSEPISIVADRLYKKAERDIEIANANMNSLKKKVESARRINDNFRTEFLPALKNKLSKYNSTRFNSECRVPQDASISSHLENMIDIDLNNIFNNHQHQPPVKCRMAVTSQQAEMIRNKLDSDGNISNDDLQEILELKEKKFLPSYHRRDRIASLCRKLSDDEKYCSEILLGMNFDSNSNNSGGVVNDVAGPNVESIGTSDIPKFLARLTNTITSPEEAVLSGLEPRATKEIISNYIQEFSLKPSPADTKTTYQFNSLQIAYRNLWQEHVDDELISGFEELYSEIKIAGGSPSLQNDPDPIRSLRLEASVLKNMQIVNKSTKSNFLLNSDSIVEGELQTRTPKNPVLHDIFDDTHNPNRPTENTQGGGSLSVILDDLEQRLQEPYSFTIFAANKQERSINFGCLVTYEQVWEPKGYEHGKLIKTITLAPKEVQRYTKSIKRHQKRVEKEIEKHIRIHKDEMTKTSRIEQDIINKAITKTNFDLSSESTTKDPSGSVDATFKVSFNRNAETASEAVKKTLHENTLRASREMNDEVSMEITSEESIDSELTESGEISNPNSSTAVTCLFYELKLLYNIFERIYKLTPVVLVAQEFPKPHEINEAWLLAHDWIIKRVLLDDQFLPVFDYLSQRVVGDQVALSQIAVNITQQRQIIQELKGQLTIVRNRIVTYRNLFERSFLNSAAKKKNQSGGGLFGGIPIVGQVVDLAEDAIDAVGDFLNPDTPDVGDSRLDNIKDAIQRTSDEERDTLMRLEREVTALNALTESYSKALAENYNQRTQIMQVRNHVKQNITHYMKAIWNHEPPDQRYLRLHEVPVPVFDNNLSYKFQKMEPLSDAMDSFIHSDVDVDTYLNYDLFEAEVQPTINSIGWKSLGEVAELDNLLGYFGNYMIFPLKQSNPVTDLMMAPYIVQGFDELTDPDDVGNWTMDEFVAYVCCLKKKLSPREFEKIKKRLSKQYSRLLTSGRRNGDIIVLPTGSLFIEMLPSTTALVEQLHRIRDAIEVKRIQAEVRRTELENLRFVDRLLNNEREDPSVDKKIVIESDSIDPTLPLDD